MANNRIELKINNEKSNFTSQSEALLQLIMGNNVFLAGPAGSGKSYVIRKYCKILRNIMPKVNIYRTSTTGLSALNIQGETIHSYSGAGISAKPYKELKKNHGSFIPLWMKSYQKIKATDVLIIDEISMFSEAQLEFLRERMEDILKDKINKIQVIVAGDFSQLSPVANSEVVRTYGQSHINYCYGTDAWKKFDFVDCYLDRIYRAKDTRLQLILDLIASGHGNDQRVINTLNKLPKQYSSHEPGVPSLLPTNREVKVTNNQWQKSNKGQEYYYETVFDTYGDLNIAKKMAKERDAEEEIRLRVGDTVMITTNDNENNPYGFPVNGGPTLKNGMIGQFLGVSQAPKNRKKSEPKRLTGNEKLGFLYKANGKSFLYLITPHHEAILNPKDEVVAGFTQYPLKLAYAISIHKSQGQTFSKIAVDLHNCWSPGLGYVALSRATNISGITLVTPNEWVTPWNAKALTIDSRSMKIKNNLMLHAKENRKKYSKIYPIVAWDIVYIIKNRSAANSLIDLINQASLRVSSTANPPRFTIK